MFRLFRRKKKETPEKKIEEKEEERGSNEIKPSEIISEETVDPTKTIFEVKETPFDEKFGQYAKILPESILEEDTIDQQTMLPIIESLVDQNDSFSSFISPQIITRHSSTPSSVSEIIPSIQKDLPPVSLEERIEGALFAIGRPIHISEIIDNFDEDSPTIKRATRRLSRKKKRNSPLIIKEISKDRWVLELNPIFHEFFQPLVPDLFLSTSERIVLTEIAYRQPISLALVKKMITGIGPIKVTEICQKLEENGFVISEKRSRSLIYTSTPKFARAFGFDNESRRLKLQMLWRLKRLMGDFEEEEPEGLDDLSKEESSDQKDSGIKQEDSSSTTLDKERTVDLTEEEQSFEDKNAVSVIATTASTSGEIENLEENESDFRDDRLMVNLNEETEHQPTQGSVYDKTGFDEEPKNILEKSESISHPEDSDQDKTIKELQLSNHTEMHEEE